MTDEEPLAVQCARALGWTDIQWTVVQGAWGRHPSGKGGSDKRGYMQIPRYGEDAPDGWAVTGPLLSEYRFDVYASSPDGAYRATAWWPFTTPASSIHADAPSAPEAIARLVVKLHEMEKLKA